MDDVAFIPIAYIFYMILHEDLHDFNIICDMFSDVIKDDFLKDVKNTWGRVLLLVKM